ncbi:MAG: hypothetical protein QOH91_100, partial [Mycobacterium sp.]|nr:hypothetical protein [Mycobacterium sp.]
HARAAAWAAGAAPAAGEWLHIDIDATITIDHSDNKGATRGRTLRESRMNRRSGMPVM